MTAVHKSHSPAVAANQDHKRAQIVAAAQDVLVRDGLLGCTARAVAAAGALSTSAIHYYFHDIDEIIDAAMARHLRAMLDTLREVAAEHTDPLGRLYAVVEAYLATFADKPHAAFLFFEYWVASGRRGADHTVEGMLHDIRALLVELLKGLPTSDTNQASHALLSWLLGTVVQQNVRPHSTLALHAEIDGLLASTPSSDSAAVG